MDEKLMSITEAAFLDELGKIKEAGVMSFLGSGFKGIGGLMTGTGMKAFSTAAKKSGGHFAHAKKLYQKGAERVAKGADKPAGWWGGVKEVAKSPYGQMAAAGAVPVGAGIVAGRATADRRPRY